MLFTKRKARLGRFYADGEAIVQQGEAADSFFIILTGRAEVVADRPGQPPEQLAILESGGDDLFGEMACFDDLPRSATVRAMGEARVLTIDRKGMLRWIAEDPSSVFQILSKMSKRIRALNDEILQHRKQAARKENDR